MHRLAPAAIALMLAAALSLCACGQASSGASAAPVPSAAAVARSKTSHVVVVVMENKEYGDVIGSSSAPYTSRLARNWTLATNFHGVRHPSLPNYLALTGGSTFGISSDCTGCNVNATSLGTQLSGAGISWKAYMEGAPRPCFKGASAGLYAKKHDPFMYYDQIRNSPRLCAHVVPATELAGDLRSGRLPALAWISPNLCHDTHDCSVSTGDRYLARLVPPLLRALGPHGFLVLTWDEGDSDAGCCGGLANGGRIPTIIAGPAIRHRARIGAGYSHYSTLRTIEDVFRLPPLRDAGASGTVPLNAAFKAAAPSFR